MNSVGLNSAQTGLQNGGHARAHACAAGLAKRPLLITGEEPCTLFGCVNDIFEQTPPLSILYHSRSPMANGDRPSSSELVLARIGNG